MLLFQHRNNEAVEEDNRAQREVINRTKKQVALFSSEEAQEFSLDRTQLNEIKTKITNFNNAVNVAIDNYQSGNDEGSVAKLEEKYDMLALYLDSLPLNSIIGPEKEEILNMLDTFLPRLKQLAIHYSGNDASFYEKRVTQIILEQFNDNTYQPIGTLETATTEPNVEQDIKDVLTEISNDLATLDLMKETLTRLRQGKQFYSKERLSIRLSIEKIKKALQTRLVNGDFTTQGAIEQIKKISDKYYEYSDQLVDIKKEYDDKYSSRQPDAGEAPEAAAGEEQ